MIYSRYCTLFLFQDMGGLRHLLQVPQPTEPKGSEEKAPQTWGHWLLARQYSIWKPIWATVLYIRRHVPSIAGRNPEGGCRARPEGLRGSRAVISVVKETRLISFVFQHHRCFWETVHESWVTVSQRHHHGVIPACFLNVWSFVYKTVFFLEITILLYSNFVCNRDHKEGGRCVELRIVAPSIPGKEREGLALGSCGQDCCWKALRGPEVSIVSVWSFEAGAADFARRSYWASGACVCNVCRPGR